MKKSLFLLLILCLAFALAAAHADVSPAGTWYFIRMRTVQGAEVTITGTGTQVIIDLNEDGSAVLTSVQGGVSLSDSGSWTAEGETVTVTVSGQSMILTSRDGELVRDTGNGSLFFSREEPSAGVPQVSAVRAESAEAFNGSWAMFRVVKDGMIADQGTIGTDAVPVVDIGDGKLIETAADESGQIFQYVYECDFADGMLTAVLTDENGTLVIEYSLLEDGTLQGIINAGTSDEVVMYYRLLEEAAAPAA